MWERPLPFFSFQFICTSLKKTTTGCFMCRKSIFCRKLFRFLGRWNLCKWKLGIIPRTANCGSSPYLVLAPFTWWKLELSPPGKKNINTILASFRGFQKASESPFMNFVGRISPRMEQIPEGTWDGSAVRTLEKI